MNYSEDQNCWAEKFAKIMCVYNGSWSRLEQLHMFTSGFQLFSPLIKDKKI